ncbi:hypothetical protein [Acinetobacter baumannii]|uniref:KfrB domain-containing protein n=1 Tax=Acinetobacter baumannii TaxID=470 RepID=UPI001D18B32C|nr:hypothetical protein [Acinetobacter baumannii]
MKKLISLLALSTSMAVIAAEPAELDNDGGALAQQAAILNQLQPQLANLTNPNGGALVASSTNNMPVNYLNGVNSHLKPKEAKGAALSYEWMNKNDMPGRIVAETENFVVQRLGDFSKHFVVHDKKSIDQTLKVNDVVAITHKADIKVAKVESILSKELTKSKELKR